MGDDDYEGYTQLLKEVTASREFLDQWQCFKIVQLLHEHYTECFTMPALWFLQALRRQQFAADRRFWHCAIAPTIVRSSSCTYVFETEDYSNYVETVAIDG